MLLLRSAIEVVAVTCGIQQPIVAFALELSWAAAIRPTSVPFWCLDWLKYIKDGASSLDVNILVIRFPRGNNAHGIDAPNPSAGSQIRYLQTFDLCSDELFKHICIRV